MPRPPSKAQDENNTTSSIGTYNNVLLMTVERKEYRGTMYLFLFSLVS